MGLIFDSDVFRFAAEREELIVGSGVFHCDCVLCWDDDLVGNDTYCAE